MTDKNVTVVLTQSEARWVLKLIQSAALLTLQTRARTTNLAVFGRVVEGLADAMDRSRRRPAPAAEPTPLRRGGRWAGTTWATGEALTVGMYGNVVRIPGYERLPGGPGAAG